MNPPRLARLLLGFVLLASLAGLSACSRPTPAAAPGDDTAAPTEALPPPNAPESGGGVPPETSGAYPDKDEPTEEPTAYPGPTTAP